MAAARRVSSRAITGGAIPHGRAVVLPDAENVSLAQDGVGVAHQLFEQAAFPPGEADPGVAAAAVSAAG